MAYCRNCGHQMGAAANFCPECGQDQRVSVPQEERIPTEDVPVPPPPRTVGVTGRVGRFVRLGLESLGVLGAVLLAIVVLVVGIGALLGRGETADRSQPSGREGAAQPEEPEPANPDETFTRDNYAELVSDPEAHEGAAVDVAGQLLGSPEDTGDETAFQMFADPRNSEWNTVVYSDDPDLRLEADEYVRVRGTVLGSFEGENAFGGSITAPQVQAESVEVVGPTEALDPALKTVEVGQTQGDQGFSIALQKVEFGEETTRAYVALQNGTGAPAGFYTFNARILQGARQIDPTDDYEYSELEPQSDLSTGVQTEGVVTFGPAETDQPLEVQFEWSSENYDLSPNPIVFQVVPE